MMYLCGILAAILVLNAGLLDAQNDSECPEPEELEKRLEKCLEPLAQSSKHDTLRVNALTQEAWDHSCRLYNQSLHCLERLMVYCKDSPQDEMDIGAALLASMHSSRGHLCGDPKTYQRYKVYASCYTRTEGASVRCMNRYTDRFTEVNTHFEAGYLRLEEYTFKLCQCFHELIHCVDYSISLNCGPDAADMFLDLVKMQLPDQFNAMCSSADPSAQKHSSGAASGGTNFLGLCLCLILALLGIVQGVGA